MQLKPPTSWARTKHLRSKCESHFDPRRLRRLTGCYASFSSIIFAILLLSPVTASAAVESIEDLCIRTGKLYAHYRDTGDSARFASLFTEDAIWEGGSGGATGRENIEQQALNSWLDPSEAPTKHVISNHLVFSEGDAHATGSSYFAVYAKLPIVGIVIPAMLGDYRDEYLIKDGVCLISKRSTEMKFLGHVHPLLSIILFFVLAMIFWVVLKVRKHGRGDA